MAEAGADEVEAEPRFFKIRGHRSKPIEDEDEDDDNKLLYDSVAQVFFYKAGNQ